MLDEGTYSEFSEGVAILHVFAELFRANGNTSNKLNGNMEGDSTKKLEFVDGHMLLLVHKSINIDNRSGENVSIASRSFRYLRIRDTASKKTHINTFKAHFITVTKYFVLRL